jgi:hypothetical protein
VTPQQIDFRPAAIRVRCYGGNPLDLTIVIKVNGQPADAFGWIWRGEVLITEDGLPVVVPIETVGQPNGVLAFLRGEVTERISFAGPRWWGLQISGRNPHASESWTVVRGFIQVDQPLISTPGPGGPLQEVTT